MKYCAYCGNALEDDMLFCPRCGQRQGASQNIETDPGIKRDAKQTVNRTKKTHSKKRRILLFAIIGIIVLIMAVVIALLFYKNSGRLSAALAVASSASIPTDSPTPSPTATPEPTEEPFSIVGNAEAIEEISKSVVKLTCYDKYGNVYASGSGFFAYNNSTIVTNYHVIADNVYSIVGSSEGKEFQVENLLNFSEAYDLAILSVTETQITRNHMNFEPLIIGESSEVKLSDHVTAIGVPLGVSKTVSDGMVSGFYEHKGMNLIQFTAPISHGSSGGALLNDKGEVIGITSASFSDGQNFNLTVPSSYIDILYHATPNKMTIKNFFNQTEHYYSVDYCIQNYKKMYSDTVKVYGYVSSTICVSFTDKRLISYITGDSKDIYNYYANLTSDTDLSTFDMTQFQNCLDDEHSAWYHGVSMRLYDSTENSINPKILIPGTVVIVTGKVRDWTDADFPGKVAISINVMDIEIVP